MKHPLESYFRKSLARYSDMPDWEDAIQEACIQAWLDDGKYPESQIKGRAVIRGKQIILHQTGLAGGSTMTGHVGRKSTEGVGRVQGEATREKIRQYISEFSALHGREPNNVEVSKAIGITDGEVGRHRKVMKTYGVSVPLSEVKVHTLSTSQSREDQDDDVSYAITRYAVQWENDAIDKLTVDALLEALTFKQRQAVYCTHWLGLSTRRAAEYMGVAQPTVRLHLKAAYDRMRKLLEA